jgi:hypothetical protein
MKIDDLFFGARRQLKDAQTKLHKLLEILQDGQHSVDSSEVADLIKAVAKAISEMDAMAASWQERALSKGVKESHERFDASEFVQSRLYVDRPMTLAEIQQKTTFDFDRLLPDVGDEDEAC